MFKYKLTTDPFAKLTEKLLLLENSFKSDNEHIGKRFQFSDFVEKDKSNAFESSSSEQMKKKSKIQ